jgi:hypothetical protein
MKLKRWTLIIGSLGLLLAACGQVKQGSNELLTPGTPVQPSASPSETRTVATEVSQSSLVALNKTQQELQTLLTDLDMPTGAALAVTGTAQMLGQQAVGMVQMLTSGKAEALQGLHAQVAIASTTELPRGDYDCTTKGQPCVKQTSDDYVLRWKTKSGKLAVLTQDWNGSTVDAPSPTVLAHNGPFDAAGNYLVEQPTKFVLDLNVGGETLANAVVQMAYLPSTCLTGKVLMGFYTSVSAKGFYKRPGGTKILEGEASYLMEISIGKLSSKGNLNALTSDDKLNLMWDVGASFTVSPVVGSCGLVQLSGNPKDVSFSAAFANTNHSLGLAFKANNFQSGPQGMSVDLSDGVLKLDKKFVTFSGTLDDANRNCVPGESLTLTFASGANQSLEEFLIENQYLKSCAK